MTRTYWAEDDGDEYDGGYHDEPDPPELCPMGCGRTTDDVAGGPCSQCWELAERPGVEGDAS